VPAETSVALFADINAIRATHDLPPYAYSAELAALAESWSSHQAAAGDIFHNLALYDGLPPGHWLRLNENVGMGSNAADIEAAFVASADHLANYINPRYTDVGIGVVVTSDGATYVTEDFGQAALPAVNESPSTNSTIATSEPTATTTVSPLSTLPAATASVEGASAQPLPARQMTTPRLRELIDQLQILDGTP
jgi:hypothetical protein